MRATGDAMVGVGVAGLFLDNCVVADAGDVAAMVGRAELAAIDCGPLDGRVWGPQEIASAKPST